jgi:hypothetical protein
MSGGLLDRWRPPGQPDPNWLLYQQQQQVAQQARQANGGFGPRPTHPIGGAAPAVTLQQGQMPWDMAPGGGQSFANMYTPKPPAPKPPQSQQPAFGQPMQMPGQMMPVPDFQMPPVDPSIAAYGPGQAAPMPPGMPQPPQPQQASSDPALGAYPQTPVGRQPQPGDAANSDPNAKPEQGKEENPNLLFGMDPMSLLQIGLSLMGNARDGGDWAAVGQDLGKIAMQDQEKKRYDEQQLRQEKLDKMSEEMHGYQVKELEAAGVERGDARAVRESRMSLAQEMLNELPEDASPMIRTLLTMGTKDPEAFGHVVNYQMEQLRNVREDQMTADERKFQRELAQLKMVGDERLANRQFEKSLAAAEAGQFSGLSGNITGAMDAVSNIEKALGILDSRAGRGDDGTGLFAGDVTLSKLFRGADSTSDLQLFNALSNQRGIKVLSQMKGAPSDKDFEAVLASIGTGEISISAARSLLEDQLYQARRDIAQAESMREWRPKYGTISMGRNEVGQSFDQAFADQWSQSGYKNPNLAQTATPTTAQMITKSAGEAQPSVAAGPPNNAVIILKQNPTPENKKFFEETFKLPPGSADKYLGLAQPGGYRGR